MARSVKRNPVTGITTARSEKQDKRVANRAFRRKVKVRARQEEPFLDCYEDAGPDWHDNDWQDNSKRMHLPYPLLREVSNVWMFGKDGKMFHRNPCPTWLRK